MLCEDEAGPYQTRPHPSSRWSPVGKPHKYDHEYVRLGTAKVLTLFRPSTGQVTVKGVTRTTNAVLHPWLKDNLKLHLNALGEHDPYEQDPTLHRRVWELFQDVWFGYKDSFEQFPKFKMILVFDNLAGHKSWGLVEWLYENKIMPIYTPLSGSWLNMAESIQRILKRRALDGTHPSSPQEIIDAFEAVARVWNENPTPFTWGGHRWRRRKRAWERRRLAASGAVYLRSRATNLWRHS